MIDCNEWRTEKRQECANMGKVKRLELWWQLYRTSLPIWDFENFRPMDFCWYECTTYNDRALLHNQPACVVYDLHSYVCMIVYYRIHKKFWPALCVLESDSYRHEIWKGYYVNPLAEWKLRPTNIFDTGVQIWSRRCWRKCIAIKTMLS